MALATFADLKASMASFLDRTDLTSVIPDFITLYEARARRELKEWLRFSVTATAITADYALPATVSEVLSVAHNDGASGAQNFTCRLVSRNVYQDQMQLDANPSNSAGQMVYVDADIDAGTTTLRFWPPATTTGPIGNLTIEAIKVLPSLADSATTNALLREAPDAYLYGALAESAPYLLHDERIGVWNARCEKAMADLRKLTDRKLYGGTPRPRALDRVFG